MKEEDDALIEPVRVEEAWKSLKEMKGCSAPGPDGIPAVLWKYSRSVTLYIISLIFTAVLRSGIWPSEWNLAVGVPIFKKRDRNLYENYRCIHLGHKLGLLLAKVLDNRLRSWLQKTERLAAEQSGFREGHSTIDQIFTLKCLVDKFINKKGGKLYVAFLDLKGAFDNVKRELLMKDCINIGLPYPLVRILISMYEATKFVIRVAGKFSDVICSRKGVKQGCPLSPRLFSLFINDLPDFLRKQGAPMVSLDVCELCMLMFADDLALVAKSREDLQFLLDRTKDYIDRKQLSLNVKKSVVMVFRKGGKITSRDRVKWEGIDLDCRDEFTYLGCKFSSNGKFGKQLKLSLAKGKSCAYAVTASQLANIQNLKMHKQIFQVKIESAMHYGSEVWGYIAGETMEKIQLQYFKRVLGLHFSTNSLVLRGDLGLFSLRSDRLVGMIRLWEKILSMPRVRITKAAYLEALRIPKSDTWPSQIKKILDDCGFSELWNGGLGIGLKEGAVANRVRERLRDQEIQVWHARVNETRSLELYAKAKEQWGEELYFKAGLQKRQQKLIICVRSDGLPLGERRKYLGGVRQASGPYFCPMCGKEEDLVHFVGKCSELIDLRKELFGVEAWERDEIINLLARKDMGGIKRFGRFLTMGIEHRERFFED